MNVGTLNWGNLVLQHFHCQAFLAWFPAGATAIFLSFLFTHNYLPYFFNENEKSRLWKEFSYATLSSCYTNYMQCHSMREWHCLSEVFDLVWLNLSAMAHEKSILLLILNDMAVRVLRVTLFRGIFVVVFSSKYFYFPVPLGQSERWLIQDIRITFELKNNKNNMIQSYP